MTLQAKGRLDGSYQSIGYDGSGGTRHICSRNSLVGVPGYSTTTKDNWTTVFWSNQQGKGPQRDQKVKVGLVPTSTSQKNETLTLMYIVQKQWSNCGRRRHTWRLNSPRGWLPQRTSPNHYSHGTHLTIKKSPTILKYFLFCVIFRGMPCWVTWIKSVQDWIYDRYIILEEKHNVFMCTRRRFMCTRRRFIYM